MKEPVSLNYIHFERPLAENVFTKYIDLLPENEQERILKFLHWEDAHGSLLGKIGLMKTFELNNVDVNLRDIQRSSFGKPYLPGEISFNISHTRNLVIWSITHNTCIGVDVEQIKPVCLDDFKSHFNEDEFERIKGSDNINQKFFKFWCIKEAAVKADGRGLHIPLNEVLIYEDEGKVTIYKHNYYYQTVILKKRFIAAIVLKTPLFETPVNDFSQLINV